MKRLAVILLTTLALAALGFLAFVRTGPEGSSQRAKAGVAGAAAAGARTNDASRDAKLAPAAKQDRPAANPAAAAKAPAAAGESGDPRRGPAAPPAPVADGPRIEVTNAEVLSRIQAGEAGFEVLASRLPAESARVEPRWESGEEWIVETFYRQMQAPKETWTGPAHWRFRIDGEVEFRGGTCWQFIVSRVDDESLPPSTFYVTRDMKLAGSMTTVQEQGKQRMVTFVPEEMEGAKARFSTVPFDLPPSGVAARGAPAGLSFGAGSPDARPHPRMPAPEELVGAGRTYIDTEYENPFDRTTVHQRWSPDDMRWPVVSRTETTWSFRLK